MRSEAKCLIILRDGGLGQAPRHPHESHYSRFPPQNRKASTRGASPPSKMSQFVIEVQDGVVCAFGLTHPSLKHMFCMKLERDKDLLLPAMILFMTRDNSVAADDDANPDRAASASVSASASASSAASAAAPSHSTILSANALVKRVSTGSGWECLHCMATCAPHASPSEPHSRSKFTSADATHSSSTLTPRPSRHS